LAEGEITPSYKSIIATAENHNDSLTQLETEGLYATMHSLAEESETDMIVPASSYPSLSPVRIVWRSLVVGVIYVLVNMVTASVGALAGVMQTSSAGGDPAVIMLSMFIGGILLAPVMGPISTKLTLPRTERIAVLFLTLYMFAYLIGAPEILLFTTMPLPFQAFLLISESIVFLVVAVLIGVLFPPTQIGACLSMAVNGYFAQRKWKDWLWRYALATVLFFPIYFIFGFIFSPITGPYYNRPELGLGLVIPSFEVMIPVELGRGLVYALTMIPLLAVLKMPKWRLGFWMSLILAIVAAVEPQVVNVGWPLPLRLGHGVEMVCDGFAQGFMMAWLLWVKK